MNAIKTVSFRRPRAAEALPRSPKALAVGEAEEQGGISIWNGKILHSASFILNDNCNYYQRYSKL